jgi:hypothetical protein
MRPSHGAPGLRRVAKNIDGPDGRPIDKEQAPYYDQVTRGPDGRSACLMVRVASGGLEA